MKIGSIDLGERPVVLAPMEDVTDHPFRRMCRRMGAGMVYSEFVNADAIVRDIPSTMRKMRLFDDERPVAIQIYGRDAETMAEAARIAADAGPDLIDINFGCPVKKVAGKGAGSGLLRDVPRLLEITEAVVRAVSLPVTVKTRLGWDMNDLIITDLAPKLQDCGIAALTIHGRTRSQMYKGEADWSLIQEVKADPRITIPIIGNGDVTDGESARRRFEETGVDAVMVGRGAIGQPWVFEEIRAMRLGEPRPQHPHEWYLDCLKQLTEENIERIGDELRGIIHMRRHLAITPLLKGIPDFKQQRVAILRATTKAELFDLLDDAITRIPD